MNYSMTSRSTHASSTRIAMVNTYAVRLVDTRYCTAADVFAQIDDFMLGRQG